MTWTEIGTPQVGTWQPANARLRKFAWLSPLTSTILLLDFSLHVAVAKKRSNSSRMSSTAKARMTSQIEQQIATARNVLAAAESKANMSQSEANQTRANLSKIKGDVESQHLEVRRAAKVLSAVEAEILEAQPQDSELSHALKAVEVAKEETHQSIHRVLNTPPDLEDNPAAARLNDLAKLSPAQ